MKPGTIAASLVMLFALPAVGGGGVLDWVGYEQGMDQALREGKPALIYFTADW